MLRNRQTRRRNTIANRVCFSTYHQTVYELYRRWSAATQSFPGERCGHATSIQRRRMPCLRALVICASVYSYYRAVEKCISERSDSIWDCRLTIDV